MKKYLFFLFALLSFSLAKAQQSNSHKEFDSYAEMYKNGSGYILKAPKGYVDAGHEAFYWSPQSHLNWHNIRTYRMRLYSPADGVQIIYPVESYFSMADFSGLDATGVEYYVAAAKQYQVSYSQPDPTTGRQKIIIPPQAKKYYTKLEGDDVRKWFNAEKVYVAKFELLKPFDEVYTHAMVVALHGKQNYEVVCLLKSGSKALYKKVFDDLKGNVMLSANPQNYSWKTVGEAQIAIVEKFGIKTNDRYTNNAHIPDIPKRPKKYKEHLTLDGGKLVLHDRNHPNYAVSNEAFKRLIIVTPGYAQSYIHQKSGAEINISEDLYQQLKAYVARNNEKLLKQKERMSNKMPGRI